MRGILIALTVVLALSAPRAGATTPTAAPTQTPGSQTSSVLPLFAYYYQWFDPTSWNRAKIDYPELGRYSSDDEKVVRQHIQWAKAAGIDGFIVSWKSTTVNNRRLHLLAKIAAEEKFKLAMIYQGLDFSRKALPPSRVAADLITFRDEFAPDPVFYRLAGKPLTIWSGTWAFTHDQIASATTPVRSSMLVLSTEKTVGGYQRVADVTDGDAYYWSSVNPATNATYASKLNQMAGAVHATGKYWIAPFAAGFDARLVGGSKTVPRSDGATMRIEYAAAVQSSPDLLGLISWNEFSENTYIEPSQHLGHRYLDVLADLRHTVAPAPPSAVDSSESPGPAKAKPYWRNMLILIGFPAALVAAIAAIAYRRRRRRPQAEQRDDDPSHPPHHPRPMSRSGSP
jgi:hypothetical protein